jgi:hypothetical protein
VGFGDDPNRIGDERDRIADERDGIADDRDALADAREVTWNKWEAESQGIVAAAELRDQGADSRDCDARRRDAANDLDLGWSDGDDVHTAALSARRLARKDRQHAKANRIASALDLFRLVFLHPAAAKRRASAKRRLMAAAARDEADRARRRSA